MITLVVWFLVSLIALWLFAMLTLWNTQTKQTTDVIEELRPVATKSLRSIRRIWFLFLRAINKIGDFLTLIITKLFFALFPKAQKAFEKKDELTGLEQGPSSYFLMSISEGKELPEKEEPKIRRKRKNV
jgi:hypothetical protein